MPGHSHGPLGELLCPGELRREHGADKGVCGEQAGGPIRSRDQRITKCYVPYRAKLSDVIDGTSKTLLMSEQRFPPYDETCDERGAAFLEPWAGYFTAAAPPNNGTDMGNNSAGYNTCENFQELPCSGQGDTQHTFQFIARSRHGGVNAVFCDGNVQFIAEQINPGTWQELSTMNSGNSVGDY